MEVKFQDLIHQYDHFLFDCDGVLWNGSHAIPFAAEALALLLSLNKSVLLVSNTTINT